MTAFGQTAFGQNRFLAQKIRNWPTVFCDRIWPERIWPKIVFWCFGHVWLNVFLHLVGCVPLFCGCRVWYFWAYSTFLGVFNIFERVQHFLGVFNSCWGVFNIFAPRTLLRRNPAGPRSAWTALTPDRPKFRSFFSLSRHIFFLFSLSGVSSRGILVVFLKAGTLKCARLGSRAVVSNPGGFGPPPFGASHTPTHNLAKCGLAKFG